MDKLPVELLDHTLSFVDPPSPCRLLKPASLYACCLVSKRLRAVAQPLLWRAVVVDKKGDFEPLEREVAEGELGRHVRIFEASGLWVEATGVCTLVLCLAGLADVRLWDFSATALNGLDDFLPHLRHLRRIKLLATDFLDIKTPFPFPNLSSLCLYDIYTTESFLSSLPHSRYVPALRCLHLGLLSADEGETTFLPSISVDLLRQLDILQLSLEDLHLTTPEVIQNYTTLFCGTIHDLHKFMASSTSTLVKNLSIRATSLDRDILRTDDINSQYRRVGLRQLATGLPSLSLTTLLLPLLLQQPALSAEHNELLTACGARGVEVLYEDEEVDEKGDVWMRQEFRRWVVQKKRAETEKGGAAA